MIQKLTIILMLQLRNNLPIKNNFKLCNIIISKIYFPITTNFTAKFDYVIAVP